MPRVDHNEASGAAWLQFREDLVVRLFGLLPGEGIVLDTEHQGYVQFLHGPRARLLGETNPGSGPIDPSHSGTAQGRRLIELAWSPPRPGRYGYPNYRASWVAEEFTASGPVTYGFVSQDDMTDAANLAIATFLTLGLALPSTITWIDAFEQHAIDVYEHAITADELT
ncbi:MAG: hypothetical protein U0R76_16755 [Candidatus Nanopelagicales bacterium]